MSGRRLVLCLLLLAGCRRATGTVTRVVEKPEGATDSVDPPVASVVLVDHDAAPDPPWSALVRDERWDAAWQRLNALPEAERSRPEIRYVRARVALSREDAAAALALLEGLESALPLLTDDIAGRRAEAQLAVGPFSDAAVYYSARATPAAQLDAARAFEKAKDARHARAAADRVVAADKRTRIQEAEARALRIRAADPPGESERSDARWLATQGADLAASADAIDIVAKLDPGHPLTAAELMLRAKVLADTGRTDDALRALELSGVAPDARAITNLARARARGMVLFHARGRWLEAHRVLTECAGTGGPDAAEDAFLAARALSRADRDEEAVHGYEDVRRRFPKSKWAEQAGFFVPYLRMLHGEWGDCARGFDQYLGAHPGGEQAEDARRNGALCKLLAGDVHAARTAFEHLVEDEPDPLVSARMADMAALAAFKDGDRIHAIARWTDVARSRPLSWPALVARARLAEHGVALPPAIDPADASPAPAPLSVVVPPPADLLHGLGLEADAEQALRDRESVVIAGAGSRSTEALCDAYASLARARRRFQVAQSMPSSLLALAPGPRNRWAWECAFPSPYAPEVRAAETDESLPPGLLWAVMRQESGFDSSAVSPARAVGLMQLLPETARPLADELSLPSPDGRLTSPAYAIVVGARALHKLLAQFHGDVALALAAYNGGAESVERWVSRAPGMQLDSFIERIPFKETRDYVVRVMGNLARYGYLATGEAGTPTISLDLKR